MDLNSLSNILVASLNPATQKASEDALRNAEQTNFPEYLRALATVLCDPSRPPMALRVAGVILKNAFFDSRSDTALQRKYAAWNNGVQEPTRQYIRECVLRALVSPVEEARKSAAQVVGALGVLELGERRWPEMISTLCGNATSAQLPDEFKVNTLEAMGFLCETLSSDLVSEPLTNSLLTAIVENMRSNKSDIVRAAAVSALLNTLDFAEANMNRDNERDFIVSNICEGARAEKADIRCAAFNCMTKLAERYYNLLSNQYMDAFFHLTFSAVKAAGVPHPPKDSEKVALYAIEFWSTLCEQEIDRRHEAEDAQMNQQDLSPDRASKGFIQRAMPSLVELITTICLTKQSEELTDDEDDWNLAMSGGTLLGLIAQCERDQILPVVMPFVQKNLPLLGPNNWRQREAGLMAFGKILDGPDSRELEQWIREGLEFFLSLLDPTKESIPQVRDTAAWVIGCVCEYHVDTISEFLPRILPAMLAGLSDPSPIVAAKNAEAINKLAVAYRDDNERPTNGLSPYLAALLPKLVEATQRSDWDEAELRGECFEAINSVVESCALDGLLIVGSLLDEIIRRLTIAVSAKAETAAQREEINGMIQYCCGTLLVICHKLKSQVAPQAPVIMTLLVRILESHNGAALMDAHLVVGSVATALGMGFKQYYPVVLPFVIRGLENSDDYQVCQTATELVSDISRAIGDGIADQTNLIMQYLLKNLANEELNRIVKPTTISAFGDIALALNDRFEYFAEPVLQVLARASTIVVANDDPDMIDYLNELREAILETYTAILQALNSQMAMRVFRKWVDDILNFLVVVSRDAMSEDNYVTEAVIKAAVGVIGDMCKILGNEVKHKVHTAMPTVFSHIIDMCIHSDDDEMKEVGKYCMMQIQLR